MTSIFEKYTHEQISEVANNLDIGQETLTKALYLLKETPSDGRCKRKPHRQTVKADRMHLHARASELAESVRELNGTANNVGLYIENLRSLEKAVVCADHVVQYLDTNQECVIPLPAHIPSEIKYRRQWYGRK